MSSTEMQQLFNTAFLGVWNQGTKSVNEAGDYTDCKYRGPNGTKCAVGHIIPDRVYRGSMEGSGFVSPSSTFESVINELRLDHDAVRMLGQLQSAHDTRTNSSTESFRLDWEHECALIATRFGLKMPDLPGQEACDTQASS